MEACLWLIPKTKTPLMKLYLRSLTAIAFATVFAFTACKKEEQQTTDNKSEIQAHAEDQNRVSADLDDVGLDIEAALNSNPSFNGRVQDVNNIQGLCGTTTVADTSGSTWRITITYNGNNCQGTTFRTGTVVLSTPMGTRWKNAGAVITVNLQNLKVKRLSDNKSITLNGTQTLTNVSGGLLINLAAAQSITHTVTSSNMSITFDDNSQRTWNVARKKVFTYNNGIVVAVTGIGTTGNVTNAAEWGSNRFGHSFVTSITQPLVVRQDCIKGVTAGEIKHEGFATSTVTFGLNAAGQATACPATGTFFFKLVWTGPNGASVTTILPY